MANQGSRLKGIFVVFFSVFLAITICAFFYYFKIKQNENYQNQLHFRQLKDINTTFNNGIGQLKNYYKSVNYFTEKNKLRLDFIEKVSAFEKKRNHYFKFRKNLMDKLDQNKQKLQQLTLTMENTYKYKKDTLSEINFKKNENHQAKLKYIEQVKLKEQIQARLALMEKELLEQIDTIFKKVQSTKNYNFKECSPNELSCLWLKNAFESLESISKNTYSSALNEKEAKSITDKIFDNLEAGYLFDETRINDFQRGIEQLNQKNNDEEKRIDLLAKKIDELNLSAKKEIRVTSADLVRWLEGLVRADSEFDNDVFSVLDVIENKANLQKKVIKEKKSSLNQTIKFIDDIKFSIKTAKESKENIANKITYFNSLKEIFESEIPRVKLIFEKSLLVRQRVKSEEKISESILKKVMSNNSQLYILTSKTLDDINTTDLSYKENLELRIRNIEKELKEQKELWQVTHIDEIQVFRSGLANYTKDKTFDDLTTKLLINSYIRCINYINQSCTSKFSDLEFSFLEVLKSDTSFREKLSTEGTALKNLKNHTEQNTAQDIDNFEQSKTHKQQLSKIILDMKTSDFILPTLGGILNAPIIDFLGDENSTYPLILLVDNKGRKIAALENNKVSASLAGITFEHIKPLLTKLIKQQQATVNEKAQQPVESTNTVDAEKNSLAFSGYLDAEISGVAYRLFITSLSNDNAIEYFDNDRKPLDKFKLYLVGFREKSALLSSKLAISRSVVVVAILVIMGLAALIPLLKIRLVSMQQSFSFSDRHFLVFGLLSLIVVLSLGVFDFKHYSKVKKDITDQSRSIFIQLRNQFSLEIQSLADFSSKQLPMKYENRVALSDSLFSDIGIEKLNNDLYLENLFYLQGTNSLKESVTLKGAAFWSNEDSFRKGEVISLASRKYATRALKGDLWPVKLSDNKLECQEKGLFMERIYNLRDSRLTTQFSMVCEKSSNAKQYHDVLAFGTKLQTFFQAVLPANFGFAVYETDTGKVLYHSNDKRRSLVEDFYVETDNNDLIASIRNLPYIYNQPLNFDAVYSGKMHNFTIGDLYLGIPWKLAIFYDKEEVRAVNLMAIFIALAMCLFVVVLGYLIVIRMPKNLRRKYFWPSSNENTSEKKALFFISVITAMVVLTTYVIYHKVTDHHHLRYQQILNAELAFEIAAAIKNKEKYNKTILDENSVFKPNYNNGIDCYLGIQQLDLQGAIKEINNCQVEMSPIQLDKEARAKQEYSSLIIEYFWDFISLKVNIDDAFSVTKKLNMASTANNKINDGEYIDNSSNRFHFKQKLEVKALYDQKENTFTFFNLFKLIILLMISFSVYLIFRQMKRWVFERLLGFSYVNHFRQIQKHTLGLEECLEQGFCDFHRYSLVIRSSNHLKQDLLNNDEKLQKLHLITTEIFNVSTWHRTGTDAQSQVPWIIAKIFRANKITLPLKEPRTLLLEGVECISTDSDARLIVLDVLEELLLIDDLKIILFCEIAPLFMLTNQCEYPVKQESDVVVCASEVVRWANLFRKFNKIYEWNAGIKTFGHMKKTASETLKYEAQGWPELEHIWLEFWQYHKAAKTIDKKEIMAVDNLIEPRLPTSDSIDAQIEFSTFIDQTPLVDTIKIKVWSPEQIIEFFGANAGAFYRFRWELCTKAERVLLFHIANDFEPNPLNKVPIDHLTRRGYIYRDCGWHIINDSFKQFILTAEPKNIMDEWLDQANESVWRYLRIPFFALLISLLAIMVYSATDAIESALGILTAILGLIPMALRNFSIFKGG